MVVRLYVESWDTLCEADNLNLTPVPPLPMDEILEVPPHNALSRLCKLATGRYLVQTLAVKAATRLPSSG